MKQGKRTVLRMCITLGVLFLLIPLTIWLGVWLFEDTEYFPINAKVL